MNNYAGLLYVAFCLQDLARLRTLLASLLVVGAVLNHAMEFYGSEVACAVYRGKACLLGGGGEPETGGVQWVGRCLDQDWDRWALRCAVLRRIIPLWRGLCCMLLAIS